MQDVDDIQGIALRYRALAPLMDERMRRQWAAAESRTYGWGGKRAVSRATGLSPNTIQRGLAERESREAEPAVAVEPRIRRRGGGRKRVTDADPGLAAALEVLSIRPRAAIRRRRCVGRARVRSSWLAS